MGRTRFNPVSFALRAAVFCLLLLALIALLGRQSARGQPGQLWRRGFVSGEQIHLLDDNRLMEPLRCSPNLQASLSDRRQQRLPSGVCDIDYLSGTAIHDPRFGTFAGRVEPDDLVPIVAVINCMSRDDLESVLVMVESLIKRRQIRDGVTDAVYDLLMTPTGDDRRQPSSGQQ